MPEGLSIKYLKRRDTALVEMLDTIFDGVYIVDRQRRILFWNHGAEEITEFPAAEVTGRRCADNILNHIDEDGRPLCRQGCPLTESLRTGIHVRRKVFPRMKSGIRLPVLTHVAPIHDAAAKIIGAIEVFRDIRQEEEFRLLQEKFNSLIHRYVSTTTFDEVMARAQADGRATSQRRDLTVLFLDVVGFTGFTESHASEQVIGMLNDVFGVCEAVITECHGDIDKFIGDAVMAVFVDPNDAVRAAERILGQALPHLNAAGAAEGREPIAVRIGMSSGNVIQGDIGTVDRRDLTVIGDVVNIAARIQAATPPNSIAASEATVSRLRTPTVFRPAGKVPVRGKRHLVPLYQHIGFSTPAARA